MLCAFVSLSLITQAVPITVAEGLGAPTLFVLGEQRTEVDLPFRFSGGKVGWSFDLTADCRLVVAKTSKKSEGAFSTRLELHRVHRDGKLQLERVLATSGDGISSPVFSPDGRTVAYVDGSFAMVVDLKSGTKTTLGDGRAAMWDDAGGIVVWRIEQKCQVLERYADGSKQELDRQCVGEIARPVSSGVLPKGAPLPIIGRSNMVESLLGAKGSSTGKGSELRGAGVACSQGIVFESPPDGAPVSLIKNDSGWSLVKGSVCERPVAQLEERVMKTQQCSVAR